MGRDHAEIMGGPTLGTKPTPIADSVSLFTCRLEYTLSKSILSIRCPSALMLVLSVSVVSLLCCGRAASARPIHSRWKRT